MNIFDLLFVLPAELWQPIGLAAAIPVVLFLWALVVRTRVGGRIALQLALRTAVLLSVGVAIIIAAATGAVLGAGLWDTARRYDRAVVELARDLSASPRAMEGPDFVRPRLAIAVHSEAEAVWAMLAHTDAPERIVSVSGVLTQADADDVLQRAAAAPRAARSLVLRRNGAIELVVMSAIRSAEGAPIGTVLFAVNTINETANAARLAWLLLGWCAALLVLSILSTRQLINVSVADQLHGLISLLQGTGVPGARRTASARRDELAQLRVEVDRTVDSNVRLQRERDAQYELIVERLPDAVVICEARLIRMANAAAIRLFGASALDELLGVDCWSRVSSDPLALPSDDAPRYVLRRMDGGERYVEIAEAALPGGEADRVEKVIRDVTGRVRAEQALARSESVYRALFDAAPIGIAVVDAQLQLEAVNPALVRLFGRSHRSELIGRSLGEVITLQDASLAQLRKGLRSAAGAGRVDVEFTPADGARRSAMVTTELLSVDQGVSRYELLWLDLTAQRALEAQVQHAQKLDAIGQLSSGVAHDFNNLLTVIRANASLLSAENGRTMELDEIEAASVRGAALIRKLMLFSRKEEIAPDAWPVRTLLDELTPVLRRLIPAQITLDVPAQFPDASVMVDRTAFEQIMLNLATNASDAMPDGGTLTIAIRLLASEAVRVARPTPAASPRWIEFTVTDTGVGMPRDVRERAFEPFFTTKPPAKGSGLGLAIVYGLVSQMGGTVALSDAQGGGTCATLRLPECEASDAGGALPDDAVSGGAAARLLLVEDDAAVRKSTAKLLSSLGYDVSTAVDGVDALEQLDSGLQTQIIVSDVMMPRMGGVQLVRSIRERGWTVPILLVSGYSTESLTAIAAQDASVALLSKPWSLPAMSRALQERLASRNTDTE
jgi:two-component system, cell cycle sensor histidine kinase and response regulator CckA